MADGLAHEPSCFFEVDGGVSIVRRAFVEAVGTCLLAVAMVGSGLAVQQKLAGEPIGASLVIALSIAGSLVALIVALGKVSGGHYNPLITLGQWLRSERATACTLAYVTAQMVGGLLGATISTLMFDRAPHPSWGTVSDPTLLLSEFVASTGLLIIVIGCGRSSKRETGPFAVGAWLVAAIIATPSASFANPAVTLAAIFADGAVSLNAGTAVTYVVAQIFGLLAALVITKIAFESKSYMRAAGSSPAGGERE